MFAGTEAGVADTSEKDKAGAGGEQSALADRRSPRRYAPLRRSGDSSPVALDQVLTEGRCANPPHQLGLGDANAAAAFANSGSERIAMRIPIFPFSTADYCGALSMIIRLSKPQPH
jgi:hypothetical protein